MAPEHADVVIIGGGMMGLSTAYHLARSGVSDVVVVERAALGEGSTSRAAGGVRAVFSDAVNIELGLRSLDVFERFGELFGTDIDLHEVGYLFLLDDDGDAAAFTRSAALQSAMGLPSRMVGVEEIRSLSPMVETADLVGGLWSPRAGHCSPEAVVLGYATAARRLGARVLTQCAVDGIDVEDGRVTGVCTSRGRIATDTVVCAAGAWSAEVGSWVGVDLPVRPLRRQVVVTDVVDGLDPATPFTIDFSTSFYLHTEGRGLLMGLPDAEDDWSHEARRSDDLLEHVAEQIGRRLPGLGDVGLRHGWAGLYEMTPDHNAVIGEAPHVSRFLYAAGFSGHGFLMGPAVGEVMGALVRGEIPPVDVSTLSAERFAGADVRPERAVV